MEICSYWVAELDKGARMAEVAAPSLHYTRAELVAIGRHAPTLAPPPALLDWVRRQIFPVLFLPDTLPINLATVATVAHHNTHPLLPPHPLGGKTKEQSQLQEELKEVLKEVLKEELKKLAERKPKN